MREKGSYNNKWLKKKKRPKPTLHAPRDNNQENKCVHMDKTLRGLCKNRNCLRGDGICMIFFFQNFLEFCFYSH